MNIHLLLVTKCCAKGYRYSLLLINDLRKAGLNPLFEMVTWKKDLPIAQKYNLSRKQCPSIIIDNKGLCFTAAECDKEEFRTNLISKLTGDKKEIVTKNEEDQTILREPNQGSNITTK